MNRIRIGIDARSLSGNRTGIGNYTLQLLRNLIKQNRPYDYVLFSHKDFELPEDLVYVEKIIQSSRSGTLWMQYGLPYLLKSKKIDLFWGPNYTVPLLRPSNVKTVMTIHDMVSYHYPNTLPKKTVFHNLMALPIYVKHVDWVITDSISTSIDVNGYLGVPFEKMTYIHLGVSNEYSTKSQDSKKIVESYGISNDFLLYVGTIEPRKNLMGLFDAYDKLAKRIGELPELVIVGKNGWMYEPILARAKQSKFHDKIHFLNYISDKELRCFYQEAKIMIYPSMYEGFGLPVLEAMASGTPIITSNTSSLPEVVGDSGVLIDPNSSDEVLNAILLLYLNEEVRNKYIDAGLRRANQFTWEKTAKRTCSVFDHILNSV